MNGTVGDIRAAAKTLRHERGLSYQAIADKLGIGKGSAERFAKDTADAKIIYPDYKEPLWKVNEGYGFYGTMGHSEDGRFVQCHECGGLFGNLGQHAQKKHDLKSTEYRQKYQLMAKTSLMSHQSRKVYASTYQYLWTEEHKQYLREQRAKIDKSKVGVKGGKVRRALEKKNKLGTCPDQLIDKIQRLSVTLRRVPSYTEFEKEYGLGVMDAVVNEHGGWIKAVHKAGLIPAKEAATYDRGDMLMKLVRFRKKHGRDALSNDLNSLSYLPSLSTYQRAFGSLHEARIQALRLKIEKAK